jgi:acyl carrier protein
MSMSDEIAKRIMSIIALTQDIPLQDVTEHSTFQELGIDSLDGFNILFALEDDFHIVIPAGQLDNVADVRQVIEGITKLLSEKTT